VRERPEDLLNPWMRLDLCTADVRDLLAAARAAPSSAMTLAGPALEAAPASP